MNITVILCTYDRCQELAKALDSLAAQTLFESIEWEVLVVDNNSTDQTRDVVENFCRRYPGRFRYLFESQQGLSYARNAGVREARGHILAFTDDDVTVNSKWLQSLTSSLHDGEWAGVGGRIIPVWPGPLPGWLSTDDLNTMGPFVAFDLGAEAGPLTRPPYGANMSFRREAFEKYGGFRVDLGRSGTNLQGREDIEFANRLLAGGERLRYEPGAVVRHPVAECRMKKRFVLRWWFWYGRSEIADLGPPSDAKWFLGGVPLCLLRRLVRWALQWMITIGAPRRFSCKRSVWYIAGTILACYQWPRCQNAQASAAGEVLTCIRSGRRRKPARPGNSHLLLPSQTELALETMPLDGAQDRPKILFVTSHWPLAAAYGAQQRVLNIGRLLSRFGDVSFVIVPTEHEDEETVRRTKREFEVCRVIRPLPVAPGTSFSRLPQRLRHEFDPTYMATDPYAVSEPDREALQELIRQHDVIWVHTIRTAHWFRIYRWPHSVLDVDDLPSRSYQSAAQSGGSPVRRLLDLRMWWIWRRRERILPERFDALTVCSKDDRRYLCRPERIHVIPNGANPLAARPRAFSPLPRIGLIGNCTFMPNEDGVKWFIHDVWPMIKREFPRAQLRLVGRGSEGYLTRLGPDIIGLGWLEDPGEEIASWSAMIVPIKVGAGTRVKVAEGFARRCPVVATTIGAFGYDVENGREVLLADRADDFASACILLLRNPALGEALSERAHRRFLERWTWDSFESTVGTVVQDCLAGSNCAQHC